MSSRAEFEELAVPLFESLYNFACWLTHDRTEAEDLVQETYAKGLKGFDSFRRGTNFKAWMFQILRNTFLTSKSGLAVRLTDSLDDDEEAANVPVERSTPESILLANSSREAVQRAIEKLPVAYREVLLLADFEELRYAEIAETLRIPVGTVMSRLSRARRAMRESLTNPAAKFRTAEGGRYEL
jgi:RNA polymerase sigma-70 factor (ECF subfamily)